MTGTAQQDAAAWRSAGSGVATRMRSESALASASAAASCAGRSSCRASNTAGSPDSVKSSPVTDEISRRRGVPIRVPAATAAIGATHGRIAGECRPQGTARTSAVTPRSAAR